LKVWRKICDIIFSLSEMPFIQFYCRHVSHVPMNQPVAALDMIGRLVSGKWA
jgi:hypothetical protein